MFAIKIISRLYLLTRRPTKASKRRSRSYQEDPILRNIWNRLAKDFFPENNDILSYLVSWSTRPQRRTLASCNIIKRRIIVARELNSPNFFSWVEPVLYHEMCHAVIGQGVQRHLGKRCWHGTEFKTLEARHPEINKLHTWMKSGGWLSAVRSDRARRRWVRGG